MARRRQRVCDQSVEDRASRAGWEGGVPPEYGVRGSQASIVVAVAIAALSGLGCKMVELG